MNKKGQSALEYLMTYGWALVVIVIVIGALILLGVFAPPTTATCTGLGKLSYVNHGYNGSIFSISARNITGGTIAGGSYSAAIVGTTDTNATNQGNWDSGELMVFSFTDASLNSPISVAITYTVGGITGTETANCSFS